MLNLLKKHVVKTSLMLFIFLNTITSFAKTEKLLLTCKKNSDCVLSRDECGALVATNIENVELGSRKLYKNKSNYPVFSYKQTDLNSQNIERRCNKINIKPITWPTTANAICYKHHCFVDKYLDLKKN